MNGISGAASQAEGVLKDTAGAQLIAQTLDKLNTARALSGPAVDAGYQFRKDVLAAAGIGANLSVTA